MTDSLTIILVTRNVAPFIGSAIRQAQEAAGLTGAQVVAVDGGSTDGTWEALTAQKDWTVRRQRSTGLAAAREEALALATGDIIAFLDADDTWLPGKLDAQITVLGRRPDVDIVSCMLRRTSSAGAELPVDLTAPQVALTPSGCLIRAGAFTRIGGFAAEHGIAADHEWFARVRSRGLVVEVLPEVLLHKGIHAGNLSHNRAEYRRQLAQVLRTAGAAATTGVGEPPAGPPGSSAGQPESSGRCTTGSRHG